MTAANLTEEAGDRLARRNVMVLAVAQAFAGGNTAVAISVGGIVGAMIAPDKGLATLPITVMVLGMWFGTVPVGILSKTHGRRFALQAGTACGTLSGLVSSVAILMASFPLFLFGAFLSGLYAAAHQSYRFAATDTASEKFKPKAISWVMTGGLFAGLIGPQLIIFTKDLWPPYMFAATFVGQAVVAVIAGLTLTFLTLPKPTTHMRQASGRPLLEILRMPRFLIAVMCGVAAYATMNLIMTSAPLAMVECGHSVTMATLGLQWHILAMFGPSFFTGALILRFGVHWVVLTGLLLLLASAAVGAAGITVAHFWIMLILLGLGWNFAFIGATTMVTECHRPEERNKVQAFNDFLVFGSMAIGSFASGQVLVNAGWATVNGIMVPFLVAAGILLLWLSFLERAKTA